MNKQIKLIVAGVLIVLGVLSVLVLNPSQPAFECAEDQKVTSGIVDDELDCGVSIESYEKYVDWESSPKIGNILGLTFVAGGVGLAGVTIFSKSKK